MKRTLDAVGALRLFWAGDCAAAADATASKPANNHTGPDREVEWNMKKLPAKHITETHPKPQTV